MAEASAIQAGHPEINEKLPSSISTHIDHWADRAKESDKVNNSTIPNYKSSIKKFYRTSGFKKPIEPERFNTDADELHRNPEAISSRISTEISSRSMKYGVKKYFQYLQSDTDNFEAKNMITTLISDLDALEYSDDTSGDLGEKVVSKNAVKIICADAEDKDDQLGLISKTMYETASRAVGMKLLLWKDVWKDRYNDSELDDTEIFIHRHRSKSKESRVVRVSPELRKKLKDLENKRNPDEDEFVFFPEMTRGSLYNKLYDFFKDHSKEATPHYFRHSRLTHMTIELYDNSDLGLGNIKERIKDYAGHQKMETTEDYIELAEEKIKRRDDSLDQLKDVNW